MESMKNKNLKLIELEYNIIKLEHNIYKEYKKELKKYNIKLVQESTTFKTYYKLNSGNFSMFNKIVNSLIERKINIKIEKNLTIIIYDIKNLRFILNDLKNNF